MVWVVKAELLDNYTVFIEFNDGLSGILDFKEKIMNDHRQIIRDLLNISLFQTVKLERDTLCWDNGVDFAPEYLYAQVKSEKKIA
jgi:uncharacterized protein YkvS